MAADRHLRPLDFAQKRLQNARNAILENKVSKNFRGGMPPNPPRYVSSFWPRAPILSPSKNKKVRIWPSEKNI